MKFNKLALTLSASILALGLAASAASAQELTLSGSVGGFSDYRLRGVSLSDKTPVLQGAIEASYSVNDKFVPFAGVWGSSLDEDAGFGALETDIYGGFKGAVGDLTYKATYLRLVYVDARGLDFDQMALEFGYPVGPLSTAVGIVQDEYDPGHSTYLWGSVGYAIPETPWSTKVTVGHEDGAYGFDDKINWGLMVSYAYQKVSFNLEYIDTNKTIISPTGADLSGDTAVFSVTSAF